MVKAYLAHRHLDTFGTVISPLCNIICHPTTPVCFAGGNEAVLIWGIRDNAGPTKLLVPPNPVEGVPRYDTVTRIAPMTAIQDAKLVVGYSNGDIRLWNYVSRTIEARFQGHRGPVTALCQSLNGELLASGGSDHDIIVWDTLQNASRFRLMGHTQSITGLEFLYPSMETSEGELKKFGGNPTHLLSSSLDGHLRLWHLETQRCVQVVSTHCTGAVHSLLLMPDQQHLVVGLASRNLEVFSIRARDDQKGDDKATLDFDYILEYCGGLQRHNATHKVSSLALLGLNDRSPPSRSTLIRLPDGSFVNEEGTERFVYDQRALLLVGAYSKHLEVVQVNDYKLQQRRQVRILLRQIEKLKKKKSAKVKSGSEIDTQLRELLGNDWRSVHADTESREIDSIENALRTLKGALKLKALKLRALDDSPSPAKKNAVEAAASAEVPTKRKRKSADTPVQKDKAEAVDDDNTANSMVTSSTSASLTFTMMSERFETIDRVFTLGVHDRTLLAGTTQNTFESYTLNLEAFFEDRASDSPYNLLQRTATTRAKVGQMDGLSETATHLAISHDDATLMSLSTGQVCLWSVQERRARLRLDSSNVDIPKDYKPLCGFFLAGNDLILVADSKGYISVFHLPSVTRTCFQQGHEGSVVAVCNHPNHTGFVSVGADLKMRTYQFVLAEEKGGRSKLEFELLEEVELPDRPHDVKYSHDGQYIAVGMANNSAQIFYADTLKLRLTLYGHSLPVTSITWSTDGQMLATGSMDRHVKIWDTEFGNILRSLPALRKGFITRVVFAFDTHYLITALSDGTLKLFDGDTGDRIATLGGNTGNAGPYLKGLATTQDSDLIFASGSDRTIKVWERTSEQMFLVEEREREETAAVLQEMTRSDLDLPTAGTRDAIAADRPTKKGVETIRDTEHLIEAVGYAEEERINREGYIKALTEWEQSAFQKAVTKPPRPSPKPELLGKSPQEYILANLATLKRDSMNEVLLGLPFEHALKIVRYVTTALEEFCICLEQNQQVAPLLMMDAETACRIASTLVHAHRRYLGSAKEHRGLLVRLAKASRTAINFELDFVRRNVVATGFLSHAVCDGRLVTQR